MTASDVVDLYKQLENRGIIIWIDGGWGVDALLGRQTRPHKDLDIAIQLKDVPGLRQLLEDSGFQETKLEIARGWNFVLGDECRREVDVHVIVIDEQGNGIYGPPENGTMYPAASLTGSGSIAGNAVRCISPEWSVKFHCGYELKQKDFDDVAALCEKFDLRLPAEFGRFKK